MRLTLLQMMKLVVGFAFASAYVLPFVRLAEAGIATWSAMLSVGAIGIPLVFALTTAVLARQGDFKDWLIRLLGMISRRRALAWLHGVCRDAPWPGISVARPGSLLGGVRERLARIAWRVRAIPHRSSAGSSGSPCQMEDRTLTTLRE